MRETSLLFALLLAVAGASLTARSALAEVPVGATAAKPLAVGDHAPAFSVEFADGKPYRFDPKLLSGPQIVIFYRGGWCPYCNMQLSDMHLVEPKLRASGFDIVFLSTDRPQLLYTSPKEKDLNYTLLSDSQLHAAEAFHVAYKLDDPSYARQLRYGVDLEKTTGTRKHELPVPSVFIIDKSGMIRFVYSNPDFTVRLGADDLWKAAQPFASTKKSP
jgi:peroxiredoxin